MTPGNRFFWGDDPPWQIERVLEKDMRYIVACFPNKEDALECLNVIKRSVEVERGAEVIHA